MERGDLKVEPPVERLSVNAASVELHLGGTYLLPSFQMQYAVVDAEDPPDNLFVEHSFKDHGINGLLVRPQQFMLVATAEFVDLSRNLAAKVDGKSTLGRLGLDVHSTAGFIDPGFRGNITLELYNKSPYSIRLTEGMAIAQLVCERLTCPAERPYGAAGLGSRYQDSVGPVQPRRATMVPLSEVLLPAADRLPDPVGYIRSWEA
jgi:dCTP deaminase